MSALPEWIEEIHPGFFEHDYRGRKLKEALAIAWEALESYAKNAELGCEYPANDAMRRITELGKE